jgi:hypothetical protein
MVMTENLLMIGRTARLRPRRQQLAASQKVFPAHEGKGCLADIVDDAGIVKIQNRKRLIAHAVDPRADRRLERRQYVHGQNKPQESVAARTLVL